MDIATLQAWLPTGIAAGALALIWGDVRSTKRELTSRVEEVTSTFKRLLFRDDGSTNYMLRQSCEREQSRCQTITCGKIEALSAKMDLMDAKREHAKEQQTAQMGDIKQALAVLSERVEQLSQDVSQQTAKGGSHVKDFSK
jgi:uncharacterized protein YceH (UPF0502 family)